MEKVSFSYYNYRPCLKVGFIATMQTIPVVGDEIYVEAKFISLVNKKIKNHHFITHHGMMFKVVKRTKYFGSPLGEDWRINLEPTEVYWWGI